MWAGIAYSVQSFATGWKDGPGRKFRTRPDWFWGPPNLYNGYRLSFPGINRPGHGVDDPLPHLAPRLKKEYNCTPSPFLGLHGLC